MNSAVNVNLKPCNCGHAAWLAGHKNGQERHSDTCASVPALIPCPVPREFACEVVLGECMCPHIHVAEHYASCPARPVRVSCSISGTWEESEVWLMDDFEHAAHFHPLLAASRERWALVKALVTGHGTSLVPFLTRAQAHALQAHRNTVFAALARRVRSETEGDAAMGEFFAEVPASVQVDVGHKVQPRISEYALSRYVEHLIEQVGSLS